MAERVGFEPTIRLPVCRISSAVLSTTQPPLRSHWSAQACAGCLIAMIVRAGKGEIAKFSAFCLDTSQALTYARTSSGVEKGFPVFTLCVMRGISPADRF